MIYARLVSALAFVRQRVKIGLMDIVIVVFCIAAPLPLTITAPTFGIPLMVQMACVAVMAYVHGRRKTLQEIPHYVEAALKQMVDAGVVVPGPAAEAAMRAAYAKGRGDVH